MRHETIYMTAEQLGITEREHEGLLQIKGELERGELRHVALFDSEELYSPGAVGFNMDVWGSDAKCDTVCCIGGWLNVRDQLSGLGRNRMYDLFYPPLSTRYTDITPAQAARAIGNFLSSGRPRWDEAVKEH